ncbi:MAG: BREX-1 system adenine-specific DNA-methyltransferase PglX [Bacteroidetes bacterium]|nr:BREX-1 system adenine-specific DNA-methyltransferase PglX [Bacteroidota bacterium]
MNTNNLKRFAKEARIKLLDQVGRKLEFVLTHDTAELRGKQKEVEQLKKKITEHTKEQVVEMVAYTWFNRLMALRFMDANGYTIPKVVTPLPGMTNPEVLQNALAGNIEPELKLDRQRLNDLLDGKTAATDAHTQAYKMLLVASCNQWHTAMPFMFERISDYSELLLPDDLLSDYSIVADIRNGMSDEDCQQEELIGWLYQFYISDKKDDVFDKLKKNIKITAENIPAATQLFTPRWIVRYMVENTLGKLWLTLKPNSKLRDHMPYYIEAPEGNTPAPVPEDLLTTNNNQLATKLTFLDPCQGSGHVLVYAFDLYTKIYEEEGYNTNEIPALILTHNLFGIDIDERAAQLAAFALTMKARSYYPRFLRKPVQPHVIALENVNEETIKQTVKLPVTVKGKVKFRYEDLSLNLLTQADNFGSLIQIEPDEAKVIQIQEGSIWQEQQQKLKDQSEYLSRQYHCVVTNPPYLGQKGMNSLLKVFIEKEYLKSKYDLMACFMERCLEFNSINGKSALINQHSWMFLSSYDELRLQFIRNVQFENMLHLGSRTFPEIGGEVVQNTAFTFCKCMPHMNCKFIRLTDFGNSQIKDDKTKLAIQDNNCSWFFTANQYDFGKIPGSPFGYWISKTTINNFTTGKSLGEIADPRLGMSTNDNGRFLRFWHEVNKNNISYNSISLEAAKNSNCKWFPYNKGGGFKKWYGNFENVINYENDGKEVKEYAAYLYKSFSRTVKNIPYFFRGGLTWSLICSGKFTCRKLDDGFVIGDAGPTCYPKTSDYLYVLGLLNTKPADEILKLLNPTMNYSPGVLKLFPVISINEMNVIDGIVEIALAISKEDWFSRETSWDFTKNEIIKQKEEEIASAFKKYSNDWSEKFIILHIKEEELNKQFIEIYGLENELTPNVPLEEITILQEESKIVKGELFIDPIPVLLQLLSYSVGCLFGRYSLDKPGLILANQGETLQEFLKQVPNPSFMPDDDNIIPVLEGEWFTDDIVGRFKVFLKAAFSEEHFEENLNYIEDTIGKDIRRYFVKDFYYDHIKRYKKRPIYWMFSSPKGHFKALIYMHRYQPDLCSKLLNDYLQAFISKLEAAKQTQTMLSLREDISVREKTLAIKEIDKFEAMIKDCREYEKTLFTIATQKITIDLDDGVKVNYQKFKEVVVPIKGLEKDEEE